MRFKNPLLVVENMTDAIEFYKNVLGLRVVMDFGENVTLTGGVCLQTKKSWMEFINASEGDIAFGGKNAELYFEEDNFDEFAQRLKNIPYINYVHGVIEHRWGQRAVRFYDRDMHIIEVGENIKAVCRRFIESGMSEEETAERMDVPLKFVKACRPK